MRSAERKQDEGDRSSDLSPVIHRPDAKASGLFVPYGLISAIKNT